MAFFLKSPGPVGHISIWIAGSVPGFPEQNGPHRRLFEVRIWVALKIVAFWPTAYIEVYGDAAQMAMGTTHTTRRPVREVEESARWKVAGSVPGVSVRRHRSLSSMTRHTDTPRNPHAPVDSAQREQLPHRLP